MDTGQRIRLNGTSLLGTVVKVLDDGSLMLSLDNGLEVKAKCEHVTEAPCIANTDKTRTPDGKFRKGHPAFTARKNKVKVCRETMMNQLQPFLKDLGTLVEQIDAPEEKVLAIARMLPYCMPKLATVEFKEGEKRNLSAEERIAKLNAAYHHLPDPTTGEQEDPEEQEE